MKHATTISPPAPDASPQPHLVVESLSRHFAVPRTLTERWISRTPPMAVRAVDGVSFYIRRAQTFALVGESGCGKSTVARLVAGLLDPSGGAIQLENVPLFPDRDARARSAVLRNVQMIFQDPYSSLNPRWNVSRIVSEPIMVRAPKTTTQEVEERVGQLLESVGLSRADGRRYPHAFSGGQRQRISIARALAGDPMLLICDEPTSALDVSVQAQILNLMKDQQRQRELTMLFISHDLAVVNFIADVVGVMYLGRLCEIATPRTLFMRPLHPYSRMLRDAIPDLDKIGRKRQPVSGDIPSPLNPPPGCRFHTRCPHAQARCRTEVPVMKEYPGAWAACHGLEEGRIDIPTIDVQAILQKPLPEPGELLRTNA